MARKILVIKLGALGDIFLALDAFHAIRAHHLDDRLILLTRPQFADLACRLPWFNDVWTDSSPQPWHVTRWLAVGRQLRDGKFARVYDLQGNDRTCAYFRLLGWHPPEWLGTARGCSHRWPDFSGQRLHVTERLLQTIESAGVPRAGRTDLSWLDGSLAEFKLPERMVVLVPGCAPHRLNKRWPAPHYAELARQLTVNGCGVVVVGTAADRESIDTIVKLAPNVVNLAGRTEIGQLAALARRTLAVVGNDTGPVHIMGAAGARTLVLMCGESDPVVMLPGGPKVSWLQRNSLADLPVEEVWRKIAAERSAFAAEPPS